MKFIVAGLGSMGKRRIRCLHALGYTEISGVDPRADRRGEVAALHGIATYSSLSGALHEGKPDALVISVPPDVHHEYIRIAIEQRLPFFVEASVVDTALDQAIKELSELKLVAAPSATLLFHPAIQKIREQVATGALGKISNIVYHSGQFLPDWHPYEQVRDFYVSNPATGGAREIVPFELSWLTSIFGFPGRVCGNFRKTIDIEGAEAIDDTYNFLLDYHDFLASVTVDVVSRHATRRLLINADRRQLVWDWDENSLRTFDPGGGRWETFGYDAGEAAPAYHANIGENMYIAEVNAFVEALLGRKEFPNSMENDHRVLQLLYAIEESDRSAAFLRFA